MYKIVNLKTKNVMEEFSILSEVLICIVIAISSFGIVKVWNCAELAHKKNPEVKLLPYILTELVLISIALFFIFKYYDSISPNVVDLCILPIRFVVGIFGLIIGAVISKRRVVSGMY